MSQVLSVILLVGLAVFSVVFAVSTVKEIIAIHKQRKAKALQEEDKNSEKGGN